MELNERYASKIMDEIEQWLKNTTFGEVVSEYNFMLQEEFIGIADPPTVSIETVNLGAYVREFRQVARDVIDQLRDEDLKKIIEANHTDELAAIIHNTVLWRLARWKLEEFLNKRLGNTDITVTMWQQIEELF